MTRRRRRGPPPTGRDPFEALHPTLDLHGRTADEAEREAERWLRERRRAGERTVRLITGRGLHSVGPPVLPATIAALLDRLLGSVVEGYDPEPGGGVLRVRLRRADPEPMSAPTPPTGDLPADLVREATENLVELGIDPTPVLVREEVARIVKKRSSEAG